ncbi:hypothetical protein [Oceaniovalibus sp. ACAM 378]|jgi:hypothetical protein|uniref:hypothetical protein n=1 Tax=Oceaniovalibus sp. ACAM 378 TaxID=2599923 RepID=UPI0011D9F85A|nr:hypothetical protein [Oceaniovalibus sp. ACAM 378]TYB84508.1 hypothetical protein FQ320_21660 [Oceaniovalibus sp. ACAM 378]
MMRLALVLMIGLGSCQGDSAPPDTGLKGYDPRAIEREQAACTARGGRWGQGGIGGRFACYTDTRDGGRICRAAGDCEGLCLARSQSCAPVTPLFGCNEVLTQSGQAATICID